MNIEKITDEIIALSVIGSGVILAGYITYITGAIPDMLTMGFGMVLAYYFNKST